MIRYALLSGFIVYFCCYAFKDWYRSLCALLFLSSVMERKDMPAAMFGIPGVSPYNLLLMFVLLGFFFQKKNIQDHWRMPTNLKFYLYGLCLILVAGFIRLAMDREGIIQLDLELGRDSQSLALLFFENIVTTLKWAIPGLLVMAGCDSNERARQLFLVMIAVLVVVAVLILKTMPLTLLADGHALQKRAARVFDRSIGYHRNQISIWMAAGFWLMWLQMTVAKTKGMKYLMLMLAGLMFLALIMTGSRGGILCWAAVGILFSWVKWRKLLIIAPAIMLLALATVPALKERLTQGFNESENETYHIQEDPEVQGELGELAAASAGRTILWAYVFDKIKEQPLFGYGREAMVRTGITLDLLKQYDQSMAARHPHNAYIQMVFDNGFVGLILVLSFLVAILKTSLTLLKSEREDEMLIGGIGVAWVGCYLVSGLTASTFYPNEGMILIWCAIGLIVRQGYKPKPKTELTAHGALNRL